VIFSQNIINLILKRVVSLYLLTLVTIFAYADDHWNIKVNGRITEDQVKLEGAVVSLIKNSRLMREVVTSGNGKFVFLLKPGNDYLIEVAKPGYASKSISFSTKNVPQEKVGAGFPEFPIEIRLFQEIDGVNMEVFDHPVGRIIYSPVADDFAVDMEYHKLIRADLAQLNRDMKAARILARKEQLQNKEELEDEELVDNSIIIYTTPIGESGNSVIPEIVVEANNHVREESVQWSDRLGVDIRTGLELLDQQRLRIREQLEHLPAMLVSANIYKDGNKEILIRIINKAELYVEYKRVTQPWGSKFYFRDGLSITSHIFKLESDLEALLQSETYIF